MRGPMRLLALVALAPPGAWAKVRTVTQTTPLCLANLSGASPLVPRATAARHQDDGMVHVGFFDTRRRPNTQAMALAAKRFDGLRVRLHALLLFKHKVPGMRVTVLKLPPAAQCLYDGFRRLSHGPGPAYLYKPLLHLVLPPSIRRLILIDTDIVVIWPISKLWAHFDAFGDAVIGLANEFHELYQKKSNNTMIGKNGGVQLLNLEKMRASVDYNRQLDLYASGRAGAYIGYLGDQTLYSMLAVVAPALFYQLGCEWNRQLNMQFGFSNARLLKCPAGCGILHANFSPLKCVAGLMNKAPTCAAWASFQAGIPTSKACPGSLRKNMRSVLQRSLRTFFADCCVNSTVTR